MQSDFGTPELHRHAHIELTHTVEGHKRAYNSSQTPMDFYYKQGHLGQESYTAFQRYQAGNRFYALWYHGSSRLPMAQQRWDDIRTGTSHSNFDSRIQAEQAYKEAKSVFKSSVTALIVYNVVCLGEWAKHLTNCGVSRDRRMEHLRDGLDDLVRHFKR
jgi:hypothetical protein